MPTKGEDNIWLEQNGKIVTEYLTWMHNGRGTEDDSDEVGSFVYLDPNEPFKINIRRGKGFSNPEKNIHLGMSVSWDEMYMWEGHMDREGVLEILDDGLPLKPPKPTPDPQAVWNRVVNGGSDRGEDTKGIITVTLGYCRVDFTEDTMSWLSTNDDLKPELRSIVGNGSFAWWDFTFVCCTKSWLRSKGITIPFTPRKRKTVEVPIERVSRTKGRKKYKRHLPPVQTRQAAASTGANTQSRSSSPLTPSPSIPDEAEQYETQTPRVPAAITSNSTPATLVEGGPNATVRSTASARDAEETPSAGKRKHPDGEEPIYPSDANLLDPEDAVMLRYLLGKVATRKRKIGLNSIIDAN